MIKEEQLYRQLYPPLSLFLAGLGLLEKTSSIARSLPSCLPFADTNRSSSFLLRKIADSIDPLLILLLYSMCGSGEIEQHLKCSREGSVSISKKCIMPLLAALGPPFHPSLLPLLQPR